MQTTGPNAFDIALIPLVFTKPLPLSQMVDQTSQERYRLVRGLGLVAAVSIIIGNVIGTGVFLKARVMTCNVGTPGWVITAWVIAGLLSLAGALTYAELTAMNVEVMDGPTGATWRVVPPL